MVKPRAYDHLDITLLDPYYFPRKKPEQLCLIVDLDTELIYPVPVEIEHIDFTSLLKGNIKKNPDLARKVIPSNLIIDLSRTVNGIITGVSGMESGYKVRHISSDIDIAHDLIYSFITYGDLPLAKNLKEENKIYRYCDLSSGLKGRMSV